MTKVTQRSIRELVNDGIAHNLNDLDTGAPDFYETLRALDLERIQYSTGIYGLNAALFISRANGELYAVPSRSSVLFAVC